MTNHIFKPIKPQSNTIFRGDNLEIMNALPAEFVDLCYIDPPFFTQKDYKNIWGDKQSVLDFGDIKEASFSDKKTYFESHVSNGTKGLDAYLTWIRQRIVQIHRILKKNGSFYCHLDYHAVHYVKVMIDEIFGYNNFQREIIWSNETSAGFKAQAQNWIRGHDTILYYTKSRKMGFNKQFFPLSEKTIKRYDKEDKDGRKYKIYNDKNGSTRKVYLDQSHGRPVTDVWTDIMSFQTINNTGEYLNYPTQKPLALLERIIKASSNEGDIVFDCFAGCGTAMHAAHSQKRKWIGIDVSPTAIKVNKKRLEKAKAKVIVIDENELPVELGSNQGQRKLKKSA